MKLGDIDVSDLLRSANGAAQLAAAHNLERVRGFMETHLGCTAKEVAYSLKLSENQARRAVRKIRAEWVGRR